MTLSQKRILYLLAAVNFTHIMDFMIMMPLGPQLMQLFSITPQQFGWAVSAYSITAGVSGFAAAFFVDKYDRKKVLLFAYVGFVLGTFSCALAPTYALLVAARVLAGLFGGMIGAQVLSIVGDAIEYERRAQAMGIVMTSFSLASVLGVPAGLWLSNHLSWHAPFLAIGGLGVLIVGLLAVFLPDFRGHLAQATTTPRNPLHVLTDIAQSPRQRQALTLSTVLMLGHFAIIPFIAPSLVANAGFDQQNLFLIYLVGGLLTIFTSPQVGKLADQRGKFPIFRVFALLSLVPVWFITNLWAMPLGWVLAIAAMFFVFVNGRMIPVQAMVTNVVPPAQRGGFLAINSSVQQLATGAAATIAGAIVVESPAGRLEHYDWVGYLSMVLIGVSIWLAWRVSREGA
jgi:MFS transporter, DHA1 family, inner membrane transport protein